MNRRSGVLQFGSQGLNFADVDSGIPFQLRTERPDVFGRIRRKSLMSFLQVVMRLSKNIYRSAKVIKISFYLAPHSKV